MQRLNVSCQVFKHKTPSAYGCKLKKLGTRTRLKVINSQQPVYFFQLLKPYTVHKIVCERFFSHPRESLGGENLSWRVNIVHKEPIMSVVKRRRVNRFFFWQKSKQCRVKCAVTGPRGSTTECWHAMAAGASLSEVFEGTLSTNAKKKGRAP